MVEPERRLGGRQDEEGLEGEKALCFFCRLGGAWDQTPAPSQPPCGCRRFRRCAGGSSELLTVGVTPVTEGKWVRAFYRAPSVNGICVPCYMLCVSVGSVAGPVLCVGSLGAVSVRDARYPHVRADSCVYFTAFNGFVRFSYTLLRCFAGS